MGYSKRINSIVLAAATLASPTMGSNEHIVLLKTPYKYTADYQTPKQSTFDDSILKNDIEMVKLLELSNIIDAVEKRYDTKIVDTWVPAEGYLDELCLFVSLENQDELKLKYKDLELDIFLNLEDIIKKNQFFNMIAVM